MRRNELILGDLFIVCLLNVRNVRNEHNVQMHRCRAPGYAYTLRQLFRLAGWQLIVEA